MKKPGNRHTASSFKAPHWVHAALAGIPAEWTTSSLDDCTGLDSPICYGILKPGDHVEEGIPVIKVRDYKNGVLEPSGVSRTSHEIDRQYERSRLRTGDVLLAIRGTAGEVARVPSALEGANITQDTARIRPAGGFSSEFIEYALQSDFLQRQIALNTVGQAVRGINLADVRKLVVPIPPPEERAAIVLVLAAADLAIRSTAGLVKHKTRLKKALMQQLLTGKRRLPGFAGPWVAYKLGELFTERSETNRDGLPLLSITADRGVILRDEVERKDTSNSDKSRYKRIPPGDIGYNTMRMWQGVSALSELKGIVSPAYTVCTPSAKIDGQFAAYLFKLPSVVHLFYRHSQGLVDDTRNLKFHHFAQVPVRIPDVAEQRAIADVLNTADREIGILEHQLELYKKQKRGLMQKLLTGQIRVQG